MVADPPVDFFFVIRPNREGEVRAILKSSGGSSGHRVDPIRPLSFLTASERSFILVPEGKMEFQDKIGCVIAAGRKGNSYP